MRKLYCEKCGGLLYKNGVDRKGRLRWRCSECGKSFSNRRQTTSCTNWQKRYEKYLLGKQSLNWWADKYKITERNLVYRFSRFSSLKYLPKEVDISDKQLIIDGIFTCSGVTLIAIGSPTQVYSWAFVDAENTVNWTALLRSLKGKPLGIVGDGQKGMFKAVQQVFPGIIFQRCQSHVISYICTRLGKKPQENPKKYLRALAKYCTHVKTLDDLIQWFHYWDIWRQNYEELALEKISYINENGHKCWRFRYSHLHEAYAHIRSALPYLFNYLFVPGLSSTSNDLEGGINSPIRELLRTHRGAKVDTQKQIISLFLRSK